MALLRWERSRFYQFNAAFRLVGEVDSAPDRRNSFGVADMPDHVRTSFYWGVGGLHFVRAVAAHQLGRGHRLHVARLFSRAKDSTKSRCELLLGTAGYLLAMKLLWASGIRAGVDEIADELAENLLARARADAEWLRMPMLNFAHGRAGIFFALLSWAETFARRLPRWFFVELSRYAELFRRGSVLTHWRASPGLERTWCNGSAGVVLLWTKAYQVTGDRCFLRRARVAATSLLRTPSGGAADLCCGDVGMAFGLLAMARIDRDPRWERGATRLALRAAQSMVHAPGRWPNGLFRGFPGLVCLANDLMRPIAQRVGFPLVEG